MNDFIRIAERQAALAKSRTGDEVDQFEAEEKERDRRNRWSIVNAWGVPERVCGTLLQMEKTPSVERVKRWHRSGRDAWCLVLSGPPGTGKTTAAGWWLWRIAADYQPTPMPNRRFWTAAQLTRADKSDIEKLCNGNVLVIDDLGAEYSDRKGYFRSVVDDVVNIRESRYRRTIIATNLNPEAFRRRYGARVARRIQGAKEHGGGFWECT